MSNVASILDRDQAFAATDARQHVPALPFTPFLNLYIVTCIDCWVDPAEILGIKLGEALVESKAPEGPWFEVAIIHHTDCGSALLADDELRHGFAERIGVDERTLTDTAVLDPERTVRTDVDRVLWAREIPSDIQVSGHVYDVQTGMVTTVVDAKSRAHRRIAGSSRTGNDNFPTSETGHPGSPDDSFAGSLRLHEHDADHLRRRCSPGRSPRNPAWP